MTYLKKLGPAVLIGVVLLAVFITQGCGKKAPPQPPDEAVRQVRTAG